MEEVSRANGSRVLALLSPAHKGFAFEDKDDGFLLAMVVDACRASGSTMKRPPHCEESTPSCAEMAERRTEPGVCAVCWLSSPGRVM